MIRFFVDGFPLFRLTRTTKTSPLLHRLFQTRNWWSHLLPLLLRLLLLLLFLRLYVPMLHARMTHMGIFCIFFVCFAVNSLCTKERFGVKDSEVDRLLGMRVRVDWVLQKSCLSVLEWESGLIGCCKWVACLSWNERQGWLGVTNELPVCLGMVGPACDPPDLTKLFLLFFFFVFSPA